MCRFTPALVMSGASTRTGSAMTDDVISAAAGIIRRENFANFGSERGNVRFRQHRVVVAGDFVNFDFGGQAGPAVVWIGQNARVALDRVEQNDFALVRSRSIAIERGEISVVNFLEAFEPAALFQIDVFARLPETHAIVHL